MTRDEKAKDALEDRILKDYPDSRVTGAIRAVDGRATELGKPFELEFTDAISGSTVSTKEPEGQGRRPRLLGDLVRPCVAEMPHMKELYAKYHDQGRRVHRHQPRPAEGTGRTR